MQPERSIKPRPWRYVERMQELAIAPSPLRVAWSDGEWDGLRDLQWNYRNYQTSNEWLSWLAGWRWGQVKLNARRRAKWFEREEIAASRKL